VYHLVDHPLAPFTTLAGESKGPCINVGVPTVHGAPIFVGQQETRSILKAFGWPSPEAYADVAAERDVAVAQADVLAMKLAEACEQIAALEIVAGMRRSAEVSASDVA
jgi:hypothetical protein